MRRLSAALRGDGCSKAPDFFYRDCCDRHDVAYRTGCDALGNPIDRATADRQLRECMAERGRTWFGRFVLPWVYWAAVRLFGRRAWLKG